MPGQKANHKSLVAFRRELEDMGIKLSSSKIRKILITGGRWTAERSREIVASFDKYTAPADEGDLALKSSAAITRIAEELDVSIVTVSINLPYKNAVYKLENSTCNAKRCARYRERKSKGLTRKYKME